MNQPNNNDDQIHLHNDCILDLYINLLNLQWDALDGLFMLHVEQNLSLYILGTSSSYVVFPI